MARIRSIASIEAEIAKTTAELAKLKAKYDKAAAKLEKLRRPKNGTPSTSVNGSVG